MNNQKGGYRWSVLVIGTVAAVLVLVLASCNQSTATPTAQQKGITLYSVNLRSGPASRYPTISTLDGNVAVTILGSNQDGDWLYVELQSGLEGWLLRSLVRMMPETTLSFAPNPSVRSDTTTRRPTQPAKATATPQAQAVTAKRVNLRAGPGTNYSIHLTLDVGESATIIGRNRAGDWWNVRLASGQDGWLFASLVDVNGDTSFVPVTVADVAPQAIVPTRRPAPTASEVDLATLPSVIPWYEARNHIGETGPVCGPIISVTYRPDVPGAPTFVNIGRNYPDRTGFTAIIWGRHRNNFPRPPEIYYGNVSQVCATGLIKDYEGRTQIDVAHPWEME